MADSASLRASEGDDAALAPAPADTQAPGAAPQDARRRWRALAATVLAAVATIALADLALQRVRPLFPPVRHVHEGVADLAAGDPTVLVLGSSHARSFDAVKAAVESRTSGRQRLVTVPVEMGGFTSYLWVLEHRVAPLLVARRASLRHLMLVTTFYDACSTEVSRSDLNVPARAWTIGHYLQDVREGGLSDFNRNYVRERAKGLAPWSVLVQDRGAGNIAHALRQLVQPETKGEIVAEARAILEAQHAGCQDERELVSLARIADFAAARGLALTVVLFPLVPDIVSEQARRTTLAWYDERARNLSIEKDFRVVDLTTSTPLVLGDFAPDLDHVTAAGNARFAAWVLDHDLRWLLDP